MSELYPHEIVLKYLEEPCPLWFSIFTQLLGIIDLIFELLFIYFISNYMTYYHINKIAYEGEITGLLNFNSFLLFVLVAFGVVSFTQYFISWSNR